MYCYLRSSQLVKGWNETLCYLYTAACGPRERSRYSDSLRAERSTDRNPEGARFSTLVHTGPGAHPTFYTMKTGSLQGLKRPGHGVNHPFLSSTKVKESVELYLHYYCGPSWPVLGWTLPFYCADTRPHSPNKIYLTNTLLEIPSHLVYYPVWTGRLIPAFLRVVMPLCS